MNISLIEGCCEPAGGGHGPSVLFRNPRQPVEGSEYHRRTLGSTLSGSKYSTREVTGKEAPSFAVLLDTFLTDDAYVLKKMNTCQQQWATTVQ